MPPRKHMRDKCQVGTWDAVNDGPYASEEWTYGSEIRCRFVRQSTREVIDGAEVAKSEVSIHLPGGTTVAENSRIKLTERNNTTLGTAEYFDVIGEPFYPIGNRTVVVNCRSVPVGAV